MPMHHPPDSAGGADLARGETPLPALLTAKETQALLWSFKGKTSWEIARIQNCSESTINFHFSNIRRKLSVTSRSAALLKAIELGFINVASTDAGGAHEPD
ncbi:DNA-binding transcriptional regulator, CsgD family [Pseudomonas sp. ok272]|uniref:helix-turn-helix domain-containing protein n=1 Tax=unclassified Pseudomonas TaxID=196821 RepID=UPI0008AF6EAA|nr:DNA-binding transcriptional regulator, CsgD family [Pseudomonas sp. ok272]SFM37507.1 DNA-binding transcriptional regulator, CsgD family [Pseudomonas sp. ok602]